MPSRADSLRLAEDKIKSAWLLIRCLLERLVSKVTDHASAALFRLPWFRFMSLYSFIYSFRYWLHCTAILQI